MIEVTYTSSWEEVVAVEPVKLSITKSNPWRGGTEEFSNIYTIHGLDKDSASARAALITAAVDAEKGCHDAFTTFVRAQIYSYGDVGPNFMYESTTLSGVGTYNAGGPTYRECTVMLRAKMARSFSLSRSNQPYLRKYLHTGRTHGSMGVLGSEAPSFITPPASLTAYVAFLNAPGAGLTLGNDDGDVPVEGWKMCTFLEHRQFHRGRKEY